MTPSRRRLQGLSTVAVLAATAAATTACVSVFPNTPPAQLYRFGADRSAAPTPRAPTPRPIVLGAVEFPRAAASDGILTATGDETAYVAGARWIAPARQLFSEALEAEFETRAPGFVVVGPGDPAPGRLELRGSVLRFETDYPRPATPPTIHVTADVQLFDAGGRALADRVFDRAEPAAEDRVSAIVAAYDRAVDAMTDEIATWSAAIAAAPPAGSAR